MISWNCFGLFWRRGDGGGLPGNQQNMKQENANNTIRKTTYSLNCGANFKKWNVRRSDVYCGIMKKGDNNTQKKKLTLNPTNDLTKNVGPNRTELRWFLKQQGRGKVVSRGKGSRQQHAFQKKGLSKRRLFEHPENRKGHKEQLVITARDLDLIKAVLRKGFWTIEKSKETRSENETCFIV